MPQPRVITTASPVHSFHAYSFFIDAEQPALIDTAVASSPAESIAPNLAAEGLSLQAVRWILLTHGHMDHGGGAAAVHQATGGRASVAVHHLDADLVRHRTTHVQAYAELFDRYFTPDAPERFTAMAEHSISGELEPDVEFTGGERLDLGGATLRVVPIPGHTAGSVAYWLEETGRAFVGDTVQLRGGVMNQFPSHEDPVAYRTSLQTLLEMEPQTLSLAHNFVDSRLQPIGGDIEGAEASRRVLQDALDIEARIADAMAAHIRPGELVINPDDGPYAPFHEVARALGYEKEPTNLPAPFFVTLHGYATLLGAEPVRIGA